MSFSRLSGEQQNDLWLSTPKPGSPLPPQATAGVSWSAKGIQGEGLPFNAGRTCCLNRTSIASISTHVWAMTTHNKGPNSWILKHAPAELQMKEVLRTARWKARVTGRLGDLCAREQGKDSFKRGPGQGPLFLMTGSSLD